MSLLAVQSAVLYRQQSKRRMQPRTGQTSVLFPGVERQHADMSLVQCFKFMANYGFYKFGVEVCVKIG